MRKEDALQTWMNNERITIQFNSLQTSVPSNVGFIYSICPRDDTTKLQQIRLEKIFENEYDAYHEFQVSKEMLYANGQRGRCFILMVKSDKNVISALSAILSDLKDKKLISFLPWNQYLGLNKMQKLSIFNDQNKFMTKKRTLLIQGIKDNDDDIPLVYHEDEDDMEVTTEPENPLEKIGVTEYRLTESGK